VEINAAVGTGLGHDFGAQFEILEWLRVADVEEMAALSVGDEGAVLDALLVFSVARFQPVKVFPSKMETKPSSDSAATSEPAQMETAKRVAMNACFMRRIVRCRTGCGNVKSGVEPVWMEHADRVKR
jgi:hypothetical protein